jgi:hypothetical protein
MADGPTIGELKAACDEADARVDRARSALLAAQTELDAARRASREADAALIAAETRAELARR